MQAVRVRAYAARHRGLAGFAAGLMAAGVVGGGVALAAIPSSANGTFTACVNNQTAAVRIIDFQAGRRCATTERTVSWSKGYRYRAGWVSTGTYAPLDVVTYGGSSFFAKVGSKGRVPGNNAYWGLLAAAGAPGATGAPGAPGAAGAPGAPGATGPSDGYIDTNSNGTSLRNASTGASLGYVVVDTLNLPPGKYLISASALGTEIGTASYFQCSIYVNNSQGQTPLAQITPGAYGVSLALQSVADLSAATGTTPVTLRCAAPNGANGSEGASASSAHLAAVAVGALHSSGF